LILGNVTTCGLLFVSEEVSSIENNLSLPYS
jgi:hypothetical protein